MIRRCCYRFSVDIERLFVIGFGLLCGWILFCNIVGTTIADNRIVRRWRR